MAHLHGIHVPHRKNTQKKPVVRLDAPATVSIPMSMHIGRPAIPTVKVGDLVKVGTKIGAADGNISSDIYSSVSGKVVKLTEHLLFNGTATTAVVIESDGEYAVDESISAPVVTNAEELIAAIKDSGVVGLGGAGFPTHVKFSADPSKIEYLLINCAECEPHVTSDTVTMMTRSDDMLCALEALNRYLGINNVIIGI